MTVKILTYLATDAQGGPVNGVKLTLQAFDSAGRKQLFYGVNHLLAPFEGQTDADGTASITNVPANADCDDPASYYTFTARGTTASGIGYEDSFDILVPSGGPGTYDISTIKR